MDILVTFVTLLKGRKKLCLRTRVPRLLRILFEVEVGVLCWSM